jgi:hypothetical protein
VQQPAADQATRDRLMDSIGAKAKILIQNADARKILERARADNSFAHALESATGFDVTTLDDPETFIKHVKDKNLSTEDLQKLNDNMQSLLEHPETLSWMARNGQLLSTGSEAMSGGLQLMHAGEGGGGLAGLISDISSGIGRLIHGLESMGGFMGTLGKMLGGIVGFIEKIFTGWTSGGSQMVTGNAGGSLAAQVDTATGTHPQRTPVLQPGETGRTAAARVAPTVVTPAGTEAPAQP